MNWLSRKKWERDASEELRFHIEQQTAANVAAGMAPEEARRQAALQFGALEGVKEDLPRSSAAASGSRRSLRTRVTPCA